ncbi:MAG: bL35 family ribosomal protein [bacterium]|nr:bL35 family ribosomal protein [bacterium]
MKKAVKKRIKVTGTGKLIRRPMGVGHFGAKKTGNKTRSNRKTQEVHPADSKAFKKYL